MKGSGPLALRSRTPASQTKRRKPELADECEPKVGPAALVMTTETEARPSSVALFRDGKPLPQPQLVYEAIFKEDGPIYMLRYNERNGFGAWLWNTDDSVMRTNLSNVRGAVVAIVVSLVLLLLVGLILSELADVAVDLVGYRARTIPLIWSWVIFCGLLSTLYIPIMICAYLCWAKKNVGYISKLHVCIDEYAAPWDFDQMERALGLRLGFWDWAHAFGIWGRTCQLTLYKNFDGCDHSSFAEFVRELPAFLHRHPRFSDVRFHCSGDNSYVDRSTCSWPSPLFPCAAEPTTPSPTIGQQQLPQQQRLPSEQLPKPPAKRSEQQQQQQRSSRPALHLDKLSMYVSGWCGHLVEFASEFASVGTFEMESFRLDSYREDVSLLLSEVLSGTRVCTFAGRGHIAHFDHSRVDFLDTRIRLTEGMWGNRNADNESEAKHRVCILQSIVCKHLEIVLGHDEARQQFLDALATFTGNPNLTHLTFEYYKEKRTTDIDATPVFDLWGLGSDSEKDTILNCFGEYAQKITLTFVYKRRRTTEILLKRYDCIDADISEKVTGLLFALQHPQRTARLKSSNALTIALETQV